jgi:thiamine biosynthesis lipoprotein
MSPAPGGDPERLSRARCGVAVPVHEHTWRVLAFAQRLNRLSEGIFDPCLPEKPGTVQDLELTWKLAPAVTCQAPLKLDLGGVAKGFAVDRAVKALRAAGCDAGLVNAGGDVRVFGTQAQTILLRGPRGALQALALSDGAVAVSDQDASPPPGHRGYYARRLAGARAPLQRRTRPGCRDGRCPHQVPAAVPRRPGTSAAQQTRQRGPRVSAKGCLSRLSSRGRARGRC